MNNAIMPFTSFEDLRQLGNVLVRSGFFQDSGDEAKAIIKVLAGREMGVGAIEAMTGINIIKGRVALSANLIAAQIKRHPRYDYRVVRIDDEACVIDFYQDGERVGTSEFTAADAKRANLGGDNWQKYRRNMLFARAISNGAKWYCPDAFAGPTYTPDELGAEVDGETGEIVQSTAVVVEDTPKPEPPRAPTKTAPRRSARPPAQAGNGDSDNDDVHQNDTKQAAVEYSGDARWWKMNRQSVINAAVRATKSAPEHIINQLIAGVRDERIEPDLEDKLLIAYAIDPDSYSPPPADAPDAPAPEGEATQPELDKWFEPKDKPSEEAAKAAIEGA